MKPILKITILLQMLIANKVLAGNKIGGIKDNNELIEKYKKLSKIRKSFKSRNLKGKILFKS